MGMSKLLDILSKQESDILRDWMKEQLAATTLRADLMSETELREQSRALLASIAEALQKANLPQPD